MDAKKLCIAYGIDPRTLDRPWSTATKCAMTIDGDGATLRIMWDDGAADYQWFDDWRDAIAEANRLGFNPRTK